MAMHAFEPWIPEEWDGPVIQRVMQMSAVEAVGRPEPMTTATRHVPRSGGMGMDILGQGGTYTEDQSSDDAVLLVARKFGRAISLAEEDLQDSQNLVNILDVKRVDWATAYAKTIDNAAFGCTGAQNMAAGIPFTSCYNAVTTSDSSIGYVANTNYILAGSSLGSVTITASTATIPVAQPHGLTVGNEIVFQGIVTTTGLNAGQPYFVVSVPSTTTVTISASLGGSIVSLTGNGSANQCGLASTTYQNLSDICSIHESSDWYNPDLVVVIAHPKFKARFRSVKDLVGRPIFIQGTSGTPDTLFDYPVRWSLGARTSTGAASPTPTGNPLLVVANRDLLIVGKRSGPESYVADASTGVGFSTDETKLKVRARRAFGIGHTTGIAVLEDASL